MDKSKCYDIFQGTIVKDMKMYQSRTIKDVLFYSIATKSLTKKLNSIRLLKNMVVKVIACFDCPIYILLSLEEIRKEKKLLVYRVELGEDAVVPRCINQSDLPQSYQFYNPILRIIENNCQDHRKNLFIERNDQLLKQAHIQKDITTLLSIYFSSSKKQE